MEIHKRYKGLRWAQYILMALSFVACIVPVVVYALLNCTVIKEAESRLALGGVAVFMLAIIAAIVFRSYIRKYIKNLPCTLGILVAVAIMLLFVICLEKIIDDVKALLVVESIAAAVALVLELASMCCKSAADETKEYYLHGKEWPQKSNVNTDGADKEGRDDV